MKLITTKYKQGIGLFGFEDNHLVEANVYSNEQEIFIGDIYLGRVNKILPNFNAYFVQIGKSEEIFLPFKETEREIKCGDVILLQIKKEASKGKPPMGTTKLSLSGLYCVVNYESHSISISTKLDVEIRQCWKNGLKDALETEAISTEDKEILLKYCMIIRTNVVNASSYDEVIKEWIFLAKQLDYVVTKGIHQSLFTKLYGVTQGYLSKIKNIPHSTLEEIVTDDKEIYEELKSEFVNSVELQEKIRLYQDDFSLWKLYSMEKNLKEALDKKVWLKCGGFLLIEPTEALTVIDVNSGKYDKKGEPEEYYKKVNEEAAIEIARQIRLRNISGIIIVDFINMQLEQNKQELLSLLSRYVAKDRIKTSVIDMTALGLVEITRLKVEKPLSEQINL